MNAKHSKSITLKEKKYNQKIYFKDKITNLEHDLSKSFDQKYIIPINGFKINSTKKKAEKEIIHNKINHKKFKINTKQYDLVQINILKKLEENENSIETILKELEELQTQCPIINEFSDTKFLDKKDFNIFDNEDPSNYILVVNAANTINIVNFLWDYFSENVDNFVTCLARLKIYFSYVREENSFNKKINCVLMTSIPSFLYTFISTHPNSHLKKNKDMKSTGNNNSISNIKENLDLEYCYQNMVSLSFLEKAGVKKHEINPSVMYFLKQDISKKLIDLKIILPPEEYSLCEKKTEEKIKSFKHINLSISLVNDVILNEDNNFRIIDDVDSKKGNEKEIVLKGEFTYIIVINIKIEDIIKNIKQIEKIEKKFIESYNNIVVSGRYIYDIQKYQLLLLSDNNIYDSSEKLKEKMKTSKIKKNIGNFIYSSPQFGMSIIVNLQKVIRDLTVKLEEIKNENIKGVEEKNKEIEKLKTELKKLKIEVGYQNENNYKESKFSLKLITPPNISNIISILKNNHLYNNSELIPFLTCFNTASNYLKSYKKDILYHKITPFLGKEIQSKEKKNEWEKIKELIMGKISEKKISSNYYRGIVELLFESENSKEKKENDYNCNTFYECDSEFITFIEKLIIFIEVLEDNSNIINIESIYKGALLALANTYLGEVEILKLVNSEPSEHLFFRKIISCGKNMKFLHKKNV